MRSFVLLTLTVASLLALAGCPSRVGEENLAGDDGMDPDPDSQPVGNQPPRASCSDDSDCRPAAATCCDCPTFAVGKDDPIFLACEDVECPVGGQCSATNAVCDDNTCVLACDPVECGTTFSDGFAIDAAGCLTCAPAAIASDCTRDSDCIQTRADCCGCAAGGEDTAVPANELGGFDGMLGCDGDVACPGVNTCDPSAAPSCVQGGCALLAGELPPNACGRADLPPCQMGTVCTLNLDSDASVRGLGVCTPGS